ncbi:MAG: diacylglycerol kinase family protein [Chloroflexota bacterium]
MGRRAQSFLFALNGIRFALRQPNFRIQLGAFVLALALAAILRVTPSDWLAVILVSLAVLAAETMNTALETAVDLASPAFEPRARQAKDLAAGAVLLTAVASVVVGAYVFVPRIAALV